MLLPVRYLMIIICCFLYISRLQAQDRGVVNTAGSPYVLMKTVDMDDIIWTSGFWADRFRVCKDTMLPVMWHILNDPEISHSFRNFEIAAGREQGRHVGPPFHDGDFYKWFEGLAAVSMQAGNTDMLRQMDEIIPLIAASQREDGYIHTPVIIEQRNVSGQAGSREFADRLDFETYNMGHLMTAACIHYRATGKKTLLDIAIRAADFLLDYHKRDPAGLAQNAICPSHYMGLIELYRTTGNNSYLQLAKDMVDSRDLVTDGTDHNQDRIPFREQTKAMGHAVRANYLYAGIADLVAETGDTSLLRPLELIWDDLVTTRLYITGGCGALYDGVSPDGTSYDPSFIQQVHQAYGREYQLPGITAHNESCAAVGSFLWCWRMLLITGEVKYADLMERTLYNAILPAVSLDGRSYFYTNPLRVDHDIPYTLRWSKERETYISLCNCCPPNIFRTLAEVAGYFYNVSEKGIWVNMYGGNILRTLLPDGSTLEMEQVSDYPWDGKVSLHLSAVPGREFSVFLRIPEWAGEAAVAVNGKTYGEPVVAGKYLEIRRSWMAGDVIELVLPMQVRIMEAHPLVEELGNQVAIQRGPLVYCVESPDLPDGIRITDLAIPAGSRFEVGETSLARTRLFILGTQARIIHSRKDYHSLYRELSPLENGEISLNLIPYFAWGNRGRSEMSVWMAVDH